MSADIAVDPRDFTPEALASIAPACADCSDGQVTMVGGSAVYPHRPDLADKWLWRCSCGAYCGVHPGTLKALGSPAGPVTRRARSAAHAAFDPLWEKRQRLSGLSKGHARGKGYKWLAAQLGVEPKNCHIGMMDAATARRVVEICRRAEA
ncbi:MULTISPECIES: zinc-finger-containing protein [unclassified Sphingomonas]|uniref:zinc-finger-containing protein n=1 Tax=unclassified Sphingomonas TaxID=196159 RepID=UPI002269FAAF|nr:MULTISPECIES: zinc-finger-containing protein [unclassified Sphingomonas]